MNLEPFDPERAAAGEQVYWADGTPVEQFHVFSTKHGPPCSTDQSRRLKIEGSLRHANT